ncbi:dehydrogenase/reductase SDR family member 7 [Petromyzon marinus]|uniref:dehydrogenase/reductase SDR family member 7 n=1 Tax=Petromyzon marinus TaxID=7757 RepID=UPI003F720D19
MEWLGVLLLAGIAALLLVQLIRLLLADGDLTLMWAERRGPDPALKLRGHVVWVTGASSGIGEALARELARCGCQLVLSARREAELQRVRKNCLEDSSLKESDILVLPMDVLDLSTHEACTKAVLDRFGRVDVLVNNAGRSQRSLFMDTDLCVYRTLFELNVLAPVSLARCVLPGMMAPGSHGGILLAVSSIAGLAGVPLSAGYCASKHAVQGAFNALRSELDEYPQITISTVCPGPVQSHIISNAFSGKGDEAVGEQKDQTYKMSAERCARLIAVSLAARLPEAWIAQQPYLSAAYLWQYAPTLAWRLTAKIGRRRIYNFRNGLDADVSYFGSKAMKKDKVS